MPAKSQSQQQLFGIALSVKRGETPRSEVSDEVKKIVDNMSEKEIKDFAETKHKGLPDKKEENMIKLKDLIPEIAKEYEWLEHFIRMAKNSKDGSEFMKKARKDNNVPSDVSKRFAEMYSGMNMQAAAKQFVKDAKNGKFD